MLDVTFFFFMVFIDSLCILFSYVDNLEEIWTVSFSSTMLKNNYTRQIHGSFVFDNKDGLELDDSDEDSTIDYETLLSKHNESQY
jgi:hypothetical protein